MNMLYFDHIHPMIIFFSQDMVSSPGCPGPPFLTEDDLELLTMLPLHPKLCYYRPASLCPVYVVLGRETRVSFV